MKTTIEVDIADDVFAAALRDIVRTCVAGQSRASICTTTQFDELLSCVKLVDAVNHLLDYLGYHPEPFVPHEEK